MHLPKIEHLSPASVKEAAQLLRKHGSQARLVAGGTDIFPRMKLGLAQPEVAISLKGLAIDSPRVSPEGSLHINARMPLADIVRSPEVLEQAPMLAEAIACSRSWNREASANKTARAARGFTLADV